MAFSHFRLECSIRRRLPAATPSDYEGLSNHGQYCSASNEASLRSQVTLR